MKQCLLSFWNVSKSPTMVKTMLIVFLESLEMICDGIKLFQNSNYNEYAHTNMQSEHF